MFVRFIYGAQHTDSVLHLFDVMNALLCAHSSSGIAYIVNYLFQH